MDHPLRFLLPVLQRLGISQLRHLLLIFFIWLPEQKSLQLELHLLVSLQLVSSQKTRSAASVDCSIGNDFSIGASSATSVAAR